MLQVYRLYVGLTSKQLGTSPNELCSSAISITDSYFDGFTLVESGGRWKGQAEPSLIIIIATDDKAKLDKLILHLKDSLKQEAIGLEINGYIEFI